MTRKGRLYSDEEVLSMSVKALLKDAAKSLKEESYQDALKSCFEVLKQDSTVYEAHIFAGKAYFATGESAKAEGHYKKASGIKPDAPMAWLGLRELYLKTGDKEELAPVLESLLAIPSLDADRRASYSRELADTHESLGRPLDAFEALSPLINELGSALGPQELWELIDRATGLLWAHEEASGSEGPRDPRLVGLLDRLLSDIPAGTPGGRAVAAARRLWLCGSLSDLLQTAARLLSGATPHPPVAAEVALRAVEQAAAALPDTWQVYSITDLSAALSAPDAASGLSFASLRAALETVALEPLAPATRASLLASTLAALGASQPSASSAAPPHTLMSAHLGDALQRLAVGNYAGALESALAGKALAESPARSLLTATPGSPAGAPPALAASDASTASSHLMEELRLAEAEALLGLGSTRAQEARAAFQSLVASRPSLAWRARCLVGASHALLTAGDAEGAARVAAKAAELASRAADSGAAVEPEVQALVSFWTSAVSGRVADLSGDVGAAEQHYTAALEHATATGNAISPQRVSQVTLWRARARMALGGDFVSDKALAMSDFRTCASQPGPLQAAALAGLGTLLQSQGDSARARKVLERAVQLDPQSDAALQTLCSLLRSEPDGADQERSLLESLCAPEGAPGSGAPAGPGTASETALRRLAALQGSTGDHRAAVGTLWRLIRLRSSDPALWESLGAAYFALHQLQPALRSFSKAAELDPEHGAELAFYKHLMCGEVSLAMDQVPEAESHFRTAHSLAPGDPAVNHSLARALHIAARRHLELGAVGVAESELKEASELLVGASAADVSLASVHKLRGDVLLLRADCSRADLAGPPDSADPGSTFVQRQVSALKDRVSALSAARREYLRSIHRRPTTASIHTLSDVALTWTKEAHLRREHRSLDPEGPLGFQLRQRAAGLLSKLLKVEPASADLWHALGAASQDPAVAEYAYSRALQLDGSRAATWTALGQLYDASKVPDLAERCFQEARCHDPEDGATWEAMGHRTTRNWRLGGKGNTKIDQEALLARLDASDIAISLWGGGGFLANLWRVLDATRLGQAKDAANLASARRAVNLHPLSSAAHNALGLATEASGNAAAALRSYRTALELLSDKETTDATFGRSKDDHVPLIVEFRVMPGERMATAQGEEGRRAAVLSVRFNLARCLGAAGQHAEALQLYSELAADGHMHQGKPDPELAGPWLSLASSALALGKKPVGTEALAAAVGCCAAAAPTVMVDVIAAAVSLAPDFDQASALAFAISDVIQAFPGPPDAPATKELARLNDATSATWLSVIARALADGQPDGVSSGIDGLRGWARSVKACSEPQTDVALAVARALLMAAASTALPGAVTDGRSAAAAATGHLVKAIHAAPWSREVRSKAASIATSSCPLRVPALLGTRSVGHVAPYLDRKGVAAHPELAAAAVALSLDDAAAAVSLPVHCRRLQDATRSEPWRIQLWALYSWTLLQLARATGEDGRYRAALSAAKSGLALCRAQGRGTASAREAHDLILLLVVASDCHMSSRPAAPQEAAKMAERAVAVASRIQGDAVDAVDCRTLSHFQRARIMLAPGGAGVQAALSDIELAAQAGGWQGLAAALQGAALLAAAGAGQEALRILEEASMGAAEGSGEEAPPPGSSLAIRLVSCDLLSRTEATVAALYASELLSTVRGGLGIAIGQRLGLELTVGVGILVVRMGLAAQFEASIADAMGFDSADRLIGEGRRVLIEVIGRISPGTRLALEASVALARAELAVGPAKKKHERARAHLAQCVAGGSGTMGSRMLRLLALCESGTPAGVPQVAAAGATGSAPATAPAAAANPEALLRKAVHRAPGDVAAWQELQGVRAAKGMAPGSLGRVAFAG